MYKLATAAVFSLASNFAFANTLVDTGPEIGTANYATYRLMADKFELSAPSLVSGATLRVVGLDNFAHWDGTAEYFLFSNGAGVPGSAIAHGFGKDELVSGSSFV